MADISQGYKKYTSGSDYAKDLDPAGLAAALKKLIGDDPAAHYMPGKNLGKFGIDRYVNRLTADPSQPPPTDKLQNLFSGHANKFSQWAANSDGLQAMNDASLKKAYDTAIRRNLFSNVKYTKAEFDDNVDAHGGYAGTEDVNKWVKRVNNLTGETDWVLVSDVPEESNFYRRHKDTIIKAGGAVAGFAVGGPAGALLGAQLAGTARDIYKGRQARRDLRNQRRDWEREQRRAEELSRPKSGNLFRAAGEGVVEYATKDINKRKSDQYVKGATV